MQNECHSKLFHLSKAERGRNLIEKFSGAGVFSNHKKHFRSGAFFIQESCSIILNTLSPEDGAIAREEFTAAFFRSTPGRRRSPFDKSRS